MQFSDKGVLSDKEQDTWFQAALATGRRSGLPAVFAIETKRQRLVIGYVSLGCDPERVGQGDAEIGFRLARDAWGLGYATEAVTALVETPRMTEPANRIVAIVDPHNTRSIGVLRKAGMSYRNDIMFGGYDYPDHLYARDLEA